MYNRKKLEAYFEHQLIAANVRSFTKQKYIQNEQHLVSCHRYPTEWNSEKFISDCLLIAKMVAEYIEKLLARNEYPEKDHCASQSIIYCNKKVGEAGLVIAFRR